MAGQDDWVRMTLRLPEDLHQELQNRSNVSGRSLNTEIVARLLYSIDIDKSRMITSDDHDMEIIIRTDLERIRAKHDKLQEEAQGYAERIAAMERGLREILERRAAQAGE